GAARASRPAGVAARREVPRGARPDSVGGRSRGRGRSTAHAAHRRGDDRGRAALPRSRGISGGAQGMIGRVLRTAIGIPLIVLGVLVLAPIIGIAGDRPFSDRLLRIWARLVLLCAGAKVVARALPLDPRRSYVYVSNHTSHL